MPPYKYRKVIRPPHKIEGASSLLNAERPRLAYTRAGTILENGSAPMGLLKFLRLR